MSPRRPCVVPPSLPGVSEWSAGPLPGRSSHTWPSVRFRAWASVLLVKGTLKISSLRSVFFDAKEWGPVSALNLELLLMEHLFSSIYSLDLVDLFL